MRNSEMLNSLDDNHGFSMIISKEINTTLDVKWYVPEDKAAQLRCQDCIIRGRRYQLIGLVYQEEGPVGSARIIALGVDNKTPFLALFFSGGSLPKCKNMGSRALNYEIKIDIDNVRPDTDQERKDISQRASRNT